jgi:hypothetical protein
MRTFDTDPSQSVSRRRGVSSPWERRGATMVQPLLDRGGHRLSRLVVVLLATIAAFVGGIAVATSPASAVPITAIDSAGPDDVSGQKDLSFLTVDYASPGVVALSWGWDDTSTTGGNTRDACALFDTNGNGFANYSLCVVVTSTGTVTRVLYTCGDDRSDRCLSNAVVPVVTSTATASIVAGSDPFGASPTHVNNVCSTSPACLTADTVALVTAQLADFGGGAASLINVCSYPSQVPGSAPSDCVFTANSGFLTIVKTSSPNIGTPFTFAMGAGQASTDGGGRSSFTINGSGSVSLIPFVPGTTYDLTESVPSGWILSSASCSRPSGPTGTPGATPAIGPISRGVQDFTITSGLVTTCTFTDIQANPSLSIAKSATPTTYSAVGTVISYSYLVTNNGNVALPGLFTVTDDKTTATCPATASLAPGASINCTSSYTSTPAR